MDNRTRALVQGLYRASDVRVYINRVEDLSYHLLQFPDTCGVAVKVTKANSVCVIIVVICDKVIALRRKLNLFTHLSVLV